MMTSNNKDYYYLHDALGSVMALTDEDGKIVERYAYDAYGKNYILKPYAILEKEAAALWKMDETTGTAVADSSGYGCTGTSYQNTSAMTTTGKIKTALNFNGSSDRISIDSTNLPSSGPLTVSFWIYVPATSGGNDRDAEWMQYYKNASCQFTIGTDDRGSGRFKVRDASGNTWENYQMGGDSWVNMTVVFDSSCHCTGVYYNGDLASSYYMLLSGYTDAGWTLSGTGTIIGRQGATSSYYYKGKMDNVMIFNRVLTDEEIKTLAKGPGDATALDSDQVSNYGNPYYFTGREYDPETSLYYYRARYYDADLGRFTTMDPLGVVPNAMKPNKFNVKSQHQDGINIYQYVASNPINLKDSWGLILDSTSSPYGEITLGLKTVCDRYKCCPSCPSEKCYLEADLLARRYYGKLTKWIRDRDDAHKSGDDSEGRDYGLPGRYNYCYEYQEAIMGMGLNSSCFSVRAVNSKYHAWVEVFHVCNKTNAYDAKFDPWTLGDLWHAPDISIW
jgi:RHS repeat-associated protein